MRVILRYFNEWGILQNQVTKLSSKMQVSALKHEISNLTSINQRFIKVTLIQNEAKIELDCDDEYISNYSIDEGSILFVTNTEDEFSDMASSIASQFDPIKMIDSTQFMSQFSKTNKDQDSFLTLIKQNLYQDAQLFLEGRTDKAELINGIEESGWNAMHLVSFLGSQKFYLWLTYEGGDINLISKDGWTCLQLAIWQQHYQFKVINLILGSQVNINELTKQGTALDVAAQCDDVEALKIILNHPQLQLQNSSNVLSLAGPKTKQLLIKELKVLDSQLIDSFRNSMFMFLSSNSLLLTKPERPPIIRGKGFIVSYFKLLHQESYFVIDPQSGVLARFKKEELYPLQPKIDSP